MNHDASSNEQEGGTLEVSQKAEGGAGEPAQGAGGTPSAEEVLAVMNRYWQMMPEPMRFAFHNDPVVKQAVTASAQALLPDVNMLLNVIGALYEIKEMLQAHLSGVPANKIIVP